MTERVGLHTLKPAKGSRKPRKRIGRGEGSGTGKTAGRGQKGAGSRSGAKRKVGFEGGQNPIHMRMRKLRGPHMKKSMPFERFRTHTQPINLVKATVAGLQSLRTPDEVAELRGLTIDQVLGLNKQEPEGQLEQPTPPEAPAPEAPAAT